MALTDEMQKIALDVKPANVCLVPEKRQEVTTEGGLDVASRVEFVTDFVKPLVDAGIIVSLFIDADKEQVEAAAKQELNLLSFIPEDTPKPGYTIRGQRA